MTRLIEPSFSPSLRRTAAPSTLSLAIRRVVSRAVISGPTATVIVTSSEMLILENRGGSRQVPIKIHNEQDIETQLTCRGSQLRIRTQKPIAGGPDGSRAPE